MANQNQDTYPINRETFDVLLCKDGVDINAAKPEHFKRVPIIAESPLSAQLDDKVAEVMKVEGYYATGFATKPGMQTDPEIHARRRELEGDPIDRSKI